MPSRTICLLNDSFPPVIDGVSNAVLNYAVNIEKNYGHAIVVTPEVENADDSVYPFPVLRYPSIDTRKLVGYVAGVPFSPDIAYKVQQNYVDLLHLHCPTASAILAWQLRESMNVPLVLTWHTKFDIDIKNVIHGKLLQEGAIKALLQNVNACDEIWTVSRGAGDNLHSLGYEGSTIVMENGVDLPKGAVAEDIVREVTKQYDLPDGVPVFLFVGRMMWYKGLRIIIDALAKLRESGIPFRMVFVGGGGDEQEVREYVTASGLDSCCIYTGPIHDREALRAWYSRADLFLFPSTFDTNGLVVREAAACATASILIEGSCAAEGVGDGRNGFLIEENADSMAAKLKELCMNPAAMKQAGENAQNELYISWEDAVKKASERYEIVLDKFRSGEYKRRHRPMNEFVRSQGELMGILGDLWGLQEDIKQDFRDQKQQLRELQQQFLEDPQQFARQQLAEPQQKIREFQQRIQQRQQQIHDRLFAEEELLMERMHALRDDIIDSL